MEYEIEALIADLNLPRDVIQEDIDKGRLLLYQHNEDPLFYIDAEAFIEYIATRVPELRRDQQRVFWLALKKMVTDPKAPNNLTPEEIAAVIIGITREIEALGGE